MVNENVMLETAGMAILGVILASIIFILVIKIILDNEWKESHSLYCLRCL